MYFISKIATPILNTPHFNEVFGKSLPFDDKQLVRAVEMIAFPNTLFKVMERKKDHILEVTTKEYPSSIPLYIDDRSGSFHLEPKERKKELPPPGEIINKMKERISLPYVWGGNFSAGIPEWKTLYPPKKKISPLEETHWTFHGLDCSGLLYEATNGCTPRNTGDLMTYGREVFLEEIGPLDLILFPGHVIIALDNQEVIESNHTYGGVRTNPLDQRLSEIEEPITFRRFHPAFFQTLKGDVSS